jgi:hypothetical protein
LVHSLDGLHEADEVVPKRSGLATCDQYGFRTSDLLDDP